jgi:hypothetical protein
MIYSWKTLVHQSDAAARIGYRNVKKILCLLKFQRE